MAKYALPPDAPAWYAHYSMLRAHRPATLGEYRTTLRQATTAAIYDKTGHLRPAARAFVEAVQETPSTRKVCSEAGLRRIERIAGLLDNATREHHGRYVDGMWGIFARGGQRDYHGAKVRFIHETVCARGIDREFFNVRDREEPTVCEVGFCAGLSAMLFLESLPRARYIGWDLGDIGWTESNIELMRRAYGVRFLDVALGRAASTIPLYQQDHPDLKCDGAHCPTFSPLAPKYVQCTHRPF